MRPQFAQYTDLELSVVHRDYTPRIHQRKWLF